MSVYCSYSVDCGKTGRPPNLVLGLVARRSKVDYSIGAGLGIFLRDNSPCFKVNVAVIGHFGPYGFRPSEPIDHITCIALPIAVRLRYVDSRRGDSAIWCNPDRSQTIIDNSRNTTSYSRAVIIVGVNGSTSPTFSGEISSRHLVNVRMILIHSAVKYHNYNARVTGGYVPGLRPVHIHV